MKYALPAALALFAAAPAFAQADDGDIWNDDPYAAEDDTVLAVDRFVAALLDMPVGSLAGALPEGMASDDIREGDTLRDLGTRSDPAFEENVRGGARAMTGVIGNMVREFGTMLPELRAMGERMRGTLPQ